jgi:magnesium transporter
MASSTPLTIAYIEKRPLSAARALDTMDPGDAAAFLETIPTRFAARALSRMGTSPASSLLIRMNATGAAAALKELGYQDAAAILRLTPAEARPALLDELPEKLRRDFEASLSFPEDTVGANMTTAIMTLSSNHTIADALAQIRRSPRMDADTVFVIDDSRMLAGAVTAAQLLRYPENSALGGLMDTNAVSLSARARLSSVTDLEAWDECSFLPVISRQKQVIGALSRRTMRQAAEYRPPRDGVERTSIVVSLAEAYFASAVALSQLLAGVDPGPLSSKIPGDQT